jgi:hypothetical protein
MRIFADHEEQLAENRKVSMSSPAKNNSKNNSNNQLQLLA